MIERRLTRKEDVPEDKKQTQTGCSKASARRIAQIRLQTGYPSHYQIAWFLENCSEAFVEAHAKQLEIEE